MTSNAGRQLQITLLSERSAGTFAKVYLAEARTPDGLSRIVAVKILKEQWSESHEVLTRTRDEARLLARLHHRNILRVEALAELQGQPAIIMEFVDGVDLGQLIKALAARGERIPPRAVYKIAQDTASALEAAYFTVPYGRTEPLAGVHRDVKPSNIMLSVEGEVKVLDFGTARSNYEGRQAKTGAMRFGSLKYMSPERREGERGDHTSDIYALGLAILEMLMGENLPLLPLDRAEHDEAVADIISGLRPLGLPNEAWDDSLRQMLASMCASDPEARLNASQVVQLLRAFTEQAGGASLDSFTADVVVPVTRSTFSNDRDEALAASAIAVSVSASGDHDASEMADVGAEPGPGAWATVGAVPSRPDHTAGYEPPPAEAPQPQPTPPPPPAKNRTVLLAAVAGVTAMIGVVSIALIAGVIWYVTQNADAPSTPPPPEVVTAPKPPPDPDVDQVALSLDAAPDALLQWLKILDASGVEVLKGTPTGSGSVAAGRYTILAKVTGRTATRAEVLIDRDLKLTCATDKKMVVNCKSADGLDVTLAD